MKSRSLWNVPEARTLEEGLNSWLWLPDNHQDQLVRSPTSKLCTRVSRRPL